MLRTLTDTLYSKGSAVKWFKSKNPDEEIVFASAATILETNDTAQTGWSLRRLFQRRGVIIITRNQLVLKDSLFSIFTIFWLFILVFSLFTMFKNQDWDYLLLAILASVYILQRLPYQLQIPLKDIREVKLKPVRGIFTNGSLLTIYLKGKTINIVPAQILSEDIKHIISARKK